MDTKNLTTAQIVEKESGPETDFWATHDPETYKQSGFLTGDQIDELVSKGTVLNITWIDDAEPTEYGLRRVVRFDLDDTEVKKSLTVKDTKGEVVFEARGRMLQDMAEYLVAGGKPIPVRFFTAGNAVGIEAAR